jgi:hypothetical protein
VGVDGSAPATAPMTLEDYEAAIRSERAEAARLSAVLAEKTAEFELLRAESEQIEALLARTSAAATTTIAAVDGASAVALDASRGGDAADGGDADDDADSTGNIDASEIDAAAYLALIEAEAERLTVLHGALQEAVREAEAAAAAHVEQGAASRAIEGGGEGNTDESDDDGGGDDDAGGDGGDGAVGQYSGGRAGVDVESIGNALDVVPFLLEEVRTLSAQLAALESAAEEAGDGDAEEQQVAKLAVLEARVALLTRMERLSQFEAVLASLGGDEEDEDALTVSGDGEGGAGVEGRA